jgi:hypothetical protein
LRESLTVLAGLLVLALLAALIGPGFVDWRDYRPQIETRLSAALGVETSVAGGIGLRLLPSPRLTLNDVRVGGQSTTTSTVAVEQVTVELALSALARGDFRFSDARAEGATVSVVLDETGAIRLPPRTGSGLPAQTRLDRLTIRRSALIWRDLDKEPVTLAPIAAEVSALSLAGPWRVEGEVAGSSLRITTGKLEEGGRLRAKAFVTGEDAQIAFDGAFMLPATEASLGIGVEGSFTLAPGGAIGLSGMVRGGSRQLDLSGLVLDFAGGAARLEGEGQFLPASGIGSLALRARRLDADGLIAALGERAGFERALQALPGTFDIGLDLDQLIWRGEDFSGLALRGRLHGNGLSDASASVRVAGALIGASGGADGNGVAGQINIKAEDSRRVGLVLARAGLDPALADLVAGLGQIDAEAIAAWDGGRIGVQRLLVTGSSGVRLEGSGDIMADKLAAKATLHGLDLNSLPPATSFAGLVGQRDLALDLALTNARFRNAPPGSASLDLRREGATWRLSRLAIDGFGGVAVTGAGALLAEGGEISGRIRAPRFETLAALAGPLLPDLARQALARAGDGLSRLDAGFRLTRSSAGDTGVSAEGAAQAGRLAFDGKLDPAGIWNNATLRFDLADRRQAFVALGLPAPMQGGAGKLVLERAAGRLIGSLAGAGLSIVLEDDASGGSRLTIQADGPGQVLPEGPARLLPDGILDAYARLGFGADAVTLDNLVVNLDGASARGSLTLPREGAYSGKLALPAIDLRGLLVASLGGTAAGPGATWSTARFGRTAGLPDLALAIEAGSLTAADGVVMRDARLTLQADQDGLRFENLTAAYGGGQVRGRLGIRREGGLAQLSGRVNLTQIDLAGLTNGGLSGKLSGQLEAGGSGEADRRARGRRQRDLGGRAPQPLRSGGLFPRYRGHGRGRFGKRRVAVAGPAGRGARSRCLGAGRCDFAVYAGGRSGTVAALHFRAQRAARGGKRHRRPAGADRRYQAGSQAARPAAEGVARRCAADRGGLARAAFGAAARDRCERALEHGRGPCAGARDRARRGVRGRCARAGDAFSPSQGRARNARERAQARRFPQGRGRAPDRRGEACGRGQTRGGSPPPCRGEARRRRQAGGAGPNGAGDAPSHRGRRPRRACPRCSRESRRSAAAAGAAGPAGRAAFQLSRFRPAAGDARGNSSAAGAPAADRIRAETAVAQRAAKLIQALSRLIQGLVGLIQVVCVRY